MKKVMMTLMAVVFAITANHTYIAHLTWQLLGRTC